MKEYRVKYVTNDGYEGYDPEYFDSASKAQAKVDDYLDNDYISNAWIV